MFMTCVQDVFIGMAYGFGVVLGVSSAFVLAGVLGAKLLGGQKRGG